MTRLNGCLAQADDESLDITARITAANLARQYLEAVTRELVDEAVDAGSSWDDLAQVLGTTPQNVQQRFGSYRT
jgi:hypothetical protein